ncbi:ABC transporter substrate-binding protein [Siccirubricoccus deserti]
MTGFLPKRAMGLLALGVSLIAGSASARDLTVVAWGGSSQAAQREVYYRPFTEQTRVPLLEDSWSGGLGILRTRVQAGNPTWDVVQVESDELQLGCDEGLYERIDWAALGGRDAFMPEAVSDCGVGAVVWSVGLTYDGSRLRDAPASWADFWNTQRFPGQRTLRRGPKYTLEIALMSDGVPQSEVYRVLRTPAGVDRAFRRLDQLRPNIVWWTAGAQPGQLLASGEVVMAAAYTSRMFAARRDDRRDFRVVWNGSVYAVDHWVVLRGSQNRDNAMRFVQSRHARRIRAASRLWPCRVSPTCGQRGRWIRRWRRACRRIPTTSRSPCRSMSSSGWTISRSLPSASTPGQPDRDGLQPRKEPVVRRTLPQLSNWLLVLPLFLFSAGIFVAPIALMLLRSVQDPELAAAFPRTAAELARWDGQDLPRPEAMSTFITELRGVRGTDRISFAANRLNADISGFRSMLLRTARMLPQADGGDAAETLRRIDARWGSDPPGRPCGAPQVLSPITSFLPRWIFSATMMARWLPCQPNARSSSASSCAPCGFPSSSPASACCLATRWPICWRACRRDTRTRCWSWS